jgi:zinc protease
VGRRGVPREIEVVKEERRLRTEDSPRALLYEQLNAAAFIASPYRRPIVGWMSDLDAMTPADVRAFHQQWYVPANAAVVVAGDVDVAEVRRLAEKYYGSVPARAVPPRKPRAEPAQAGHSPHRVQGARRAGLCGAGLQGAAAGHVRAVRRGR